jgi:hypothetical protein
MIEKICDRIEHTDDTEACSYCKETAEAIGLGEFKRLVY